MSKEKKPVNVKKEILEWVISIAVALIAVFLIRTFLFTMIRVDGESMLDTLHDQDRIASTIIDLKMNGPQHGDILIVTYPGYTEYCIKRLIGMPGDIIAIANGQTILNGEPLDEPYVTRVKEDDFMPPVVLGEDEYFVMGDNRANSHDCRSIGPLKGDAIDAIARLRLWPLDRIGFVS